MEFVEGETLEDLIKRSGSWRWKSRHSSPPVWLNLLSAGAGRARNAAFDQFIIFGLTKRAPRTCRILALPRIKSNPWRLDIG